MPRLIAETQQSALQTRQVGRSTVTSAKVIIVPFIRQPSSAYREPCFLDGPGYMLHFAHAFVPLGGGTWAMPPASASSCGGSSRPHGRCPRCESPVIMGLPSHSYGFPRLTWLLLRRARVGYMFFVAHASPLLPAPGEVVGSASMRNGPRVEAPPSLPAVVRAVVFMLQVPGRFQPMRGRMVFQCGLP